MATWIPAMCAAEAAWFDAGDQQGKDLLAKLYTVSTAKEWKRLMADYAAASVLRTNQLEADLKRAGVPDVDRGEEIASRFRHSAALLKAVYRAYGADIAALDERHPEVMQQSAQTIGGRVKTSETSILNDAVAALNLDPSVSDRAADNADCQSAFSFTGG